MQRKIKLKVGKYGVAMDVWVISQTVRSITVSCSDQTVHTYSLDNVQIFEEEEK